MEEFEIVYFELFLVLLVFFVKRKQIWMIGKIFFAEFFVYIFKQTKIFLEFFFIKKNLRKKNFLSKNNVKIFFLKKNRKNVFIKKKKNKIT